MSSAEPAQPRLPLELQAIILQEAIYDYTDDVQWKTAAALVLVSRDLADFAREALYRRIPIVEAVTHRIEPWGNIVRSVVKPNNGDLLSTLAAYPRIAGKVRNLVVVTSTPYSTIQPILERIIALCARLDGLSASVELLQYHQSSVVAQGLLDLGRFTSLNIPYTPSLIPLSLSLAPFVGLKDLAISTRIFASGPPPSFELVRLELTHMSSTRLMSTLDFVTVASKTSLLHLGFDFNPNPSAPFPDLSPFSNLRTVWLSSQKKGFDISLFIERLRTLQSSCRSLRQLALIVEGDSAFLVPLGQMESLVKALPTTLHSLDIFNLTLSLPFLLFLLERSPDLCELAIDGSDEESDKLLRQACERRHITVSLYHGEEG